MTAPKIQLTEKYQMLPSMPPEQFDALKADIAERGVLTPIDIDEDGHILDGHHRYRVCTELGLTDFPTIVRPGMSEEDRRAFARKANMLRRHLSREQVRHLIAEQLKETPNWANNRIGQQLGVDSKTVSAVRKKLETTSEIPKLDKLIGADGKERPVKQKKPPAIMASNADELQRILKRIDEGDDPVELEGFLSEQGHFATFKTPNYDPFAHCDNEGKRQWFIFVSWLANGRNGDIIGHIGEHVEWILQRQFKTPDEWMGPVGEKWCACNGMPTQPEKAKRAWAAFLKKHEGQSLENIEAELNKRASTAPS